MYGFMIIDIIEIFVIKIFSFKSEKIDILNGNVLLFFVQVSQ